MQLSGGAEVSMVEQSAGTDEFQLPAAMKVALS